jgi:hypothetical protein
MEDDEVLLATSDDDEPSHGVCWPAFVLYSNVWVVHLLASHEACTLLPG